METPPMQPGTASLEKNSSPFSATPLLAPPGSTLESFAASLEFETTASLARTYEEAAWRLAQLEELVRLHRPRFRILAVKFAARLKAEDRHGCGRFGQVIYRAHKDGTGVRRERIDRSKVKVEED